MKKPREYTVEEVRDLFLRHCRQVAGYWERHFLTGQSTAEECIRGAVFSMLVAIDGYAGDVPSFQLIASPHEDDRAYNQSCGENWFAPRDDNSMDIAGQLHDLFYEEDTDVRPDGP